MGANASGGKGVKTQCCPRQAIPEALTITVTPLDGCTGGSATLVLNIDGLGPKWTLPPGATLDWNCKPPMSPSCSPSSSNNVAVRCSGSGPTGWSLSGMNEVGFPPVTPSGSCVPLNISWNNMITSGCPGGLNVRLTG